MFHQHYATYRAHQKQLFRAPFLLPRGQLLLLHEVAPGSQQAHQLGAVDGAVGALLLRLPVEEAEEEDDVLPCHDKDQPLRPRSKAF